MFEKNKIKQKLKNGEVVIGSWIFAMRTPYIVQMMANAGFDYVQIDMEHSGMATETVADLCFAAALSGVAPIVRPPGKKPYLVSRFLDFGAHGLLLPNVEDEVEAEAIVRWAKYPPRGERGFMSLGPATGFDKRDGQEFVTTANEETFISVQIESKKGIANVDRILAVDGVDAAVIGRGDMALDLGFPGQGKHPQVIECVEILIDACQRYGKTPCMLVNSAEEAAYWIKKGIRFITFGNEIAFLMAAYKKTASDLRNVINEVMVK